MQEHISYFNIRLWRALLNSILWVIFVLLIVITKPTNWVLNINKKLPHSNWYEINGKTRFNRKEFIEIIDFYLFNCPAKGINYHSKDFGIYGWDAPHKHKTLKKELIGSVEIEDFVYKCCKADDLLKVLMKTIC